MRNVPTGDRPNRRCLHRDRCGLAIERHELDLEGLAVGVHVNDRSHVAANQILARHGSRQHDSIELSNHRLNAYNESSWCSRESRPALARWLGLRDLRGLRIPVATVVGLVAEGQTTQDILVLYPDLEAEDVREALLFAAEARSGTRSSPGQLWSEVLLGDSPSCTARYDASPGERPQKQPHQILDAANCSKNSTESRQILVTHRGADDSAARRDRGRRRGLRGERTISGRHPLSLQPRAERTKLHALRQDQPL
jgi:hypothetical protein